MEETSQNTQGCLSCWGTGERASDYGPADCPDCGGAGVLPSRGVLIEWRARDIERAHSGVEGESAADVRWLIAELRRARDALTDVVALAHDVDDGDGIARRIRFVAHRALGTYEIVRDYDEAASLRRPRANG